MFGMSNVSDGPPAPPTRNGRGRRVLETPRRARAPHRSPYRSPDRPSPPRQAPRRPARRHGARARPLDRRRRAPGRRREFAALRRLRLRRHPLRRRAQPRQGALLVVRRLALPGAARFGQRDVEHRSAVHRRLRQRRRAGLLLLRYDLHHHQDLRPVLAPQRPHDRGRGRRRGGRRRVTGGRTAGHRRRPPGLRSGDLRRHGLPRQLHLRRRHQRRGRGDVHGDLRHPCQRLLLLRLRQRRDEQQGHRQRPHGRHQLRHRVLVRALLRFRPLGAGRSGERPVPVEPRLQHEHLEHRHRSAALRHRAAEEQRAEPFRAEIRQCAIRRTHHHIFRR